jgi:hypothetical protein
MRLEVRNKMLGSDEASIASCCMQFPRLLLIAVLQRHLRRERSQTTQPQQVVGSTHEVGMQLHSGDVTEARATQATQLLIQPKISSTRLRCLWLTQ